MGIFKKEKEDEVPAFYELSLKKVVISGDVYGRFGEFTIEQTFINNRTKPLEVSYTFPITETAVVTGFTVQVGDKIMHGVCKEKEAARKEYVENLASGNSAYLLNQDTANVFNVMVGKVLPNEEVHIKISYLDMYEVVDNSIRMIIPTLVNQRYKSAITDGLKYGKVDYTVDFNIRINKVLEFTSIESINHEIKKEEKKKVVLITAENYDMSKDFVLDMKFKDAQLSNALYSKTKDNEKAVLLSFMPEIDSLEDSEKEYIFVVDVSGSMGSSNKMEKTKQALKRCLNELDVGDKFNIIPFESEYRFYKMESVEANEDNIKEAIEYIDDLNASGGTEILNPIKFALYEKSENKVVIVLTDGEVGNESEIVDFVSKNIFNSKLFTIGIDTSVNTAFLKNMAKAGNGKAEFIYPNENMENAIVRTFARIQSPIVRDVTIDYGKNEVLGEIKKDNALFNYEFFQVTALLKDIKDDITLKGTVEGKEVAWIIAKDEMQEIEGKIETIYAKESIDLLEEQIRSYANDYRNENARLMENEYKKRVIDISIKYNIASKYTSFISVNERDNKVFEPTEFENIVLSDRELDKGMKFSKMSAPCGARVKMADNRCGVICDEVVDGYQVDNKNESLEIIEESFKDWKSLDIYTFLLTVIYLLHFNSSLDVVSIFNEYIRDYKGDLEDENTQLLLLHLSKNINLEKIIIENFLTGIYKKIAITNAKYDYNLLKLNYGKDTSKKLQNGMTLREFVLKCF